jgi:hypothetical protein
LIKRGADLSELRVSAVKKEFGISPEALRTLRGEFETTNLCDLRVSAVKTVLGDPRWPA